MLPLLTIQRLLMNRKHVIDGFEYQFISVEESEDGTQVDITVNVVLPKKGQSYVGEKFNRNCSLIIGKVYEFLDYIFPFDLTILVDGKYASDFYLSPEDYNEINQAVKETITSIMLINHNTLFNVQVTANTTFILNPNQKPQIDSDMIIFYFLYEIHDIKLNDKKTKLNPNQIEVFGEVFNEKLLNSDSFRDILVDLLYGVLENTLGITNDDIYLAPQYWLTKINGVDVDITGNSYSISFTPKMFS